jgi:LruC domain-containing protein
MKKNKLTPMMLLLVLLLGQALLFSCKKDHEPESSGGIQDWGSLPGSFSWQTTAIGVLHVTLKYPSQPETACRFDIYYNHQGNKQVYAGGISGSKPVSISVQVPSFVGNLQLVCVSPTGTRVQKEVTFSSEMTCDLSIQDEKSGTAFTDKDGDGLGDAIDDFPDDPDKAFRYSYPASGGMMKSPLVPWSWATLCFEDLWPGMGDFDMNDLVINYNYEVVTNASHIVRTIEAHYVVKAAGAKSSWENGFGVELTGVPPLDVESVTGCVMDGGNQILLTSSGLEKGTNGQPLNPAVIIPFENYQTVIHRTEMGYFNTMPGQPEGYGDQVDIVVDLINTTTLTDANILPAAFHPFLFVDNKRTWEIHLCDQPPTDLANMSLFGTLQDASNPSQNKWYKTRGGLPWAIDLPVDFAYAAEYQDIRLAYPQIVTWARSGGVTNTDWYLYPDPTYLYSPSGTPNLSTGLIAYYPFNGNASDATGNGNNGTVTGAVLTNDRHGETNKSYYFSGSGCSTRIDADINTSSITNAMSLAFWVMRTGSGCIAPRVMEFWPGSDATSQLVVDIGARDHYSISHWVSGGVLSLASGTFSNNQWVHLVYTNDGTTACVYQNGQLIQSKPSPGLPVLAGDVAFGRMNHPAWDAFEGKLDEIRLYNRSLTQSEVLTLYGEGGGVASTPTWELLIPSSQYDGNEVSFNAMAYDPVNNLLYSATIQKVYQFNLKTRSVAVIPASNPLGRMDAFVYDYTNNRLLGVRAGRDKVYALPVTGGTWTETYPGSFDSESYRSLLFWNPANNSIGFFGGYGGFMMKNWIWENDGTGWNNPYPDNNNCNPAKRTGNMAFGGIGSNMVYIFSGIGSCDGNQFSQSCSLGSPVGNDIGVYCWLRDLWELDLTTHTFANILPVNNQTIHQMGEFTCDYLHNTFFQVGGYIPNETYNPSYIPDYSNTVYRYRRGIDAGFEELQISGTPPPVVPADDSFHVTTVYDPVFNRVIWARSDGIWAINL